MLAVVANAPATLQIPIAGHPAVGTSFVIAILRAMALSTKDDGFRKRNRLSIRQSQRGITVTRVMAAYAAQLSMGDPESLMKLIQVTGLRIFGFRGTQTVACRALQLALMRSAVSCCHRDSKHGTHDRWRRPDRGRVLDERLVLTFG